MLTPAGVGAGSGVGGERNVFGSACKAANQAAGEAWEVRATPEKATALGLIGMR